MYAYPIHGSEARADRTAQPAAICASGYVLNAGGGSPITVRGGTFVNHRPGVGQKLRSGLFLPWGISVLANLPLR